MPIKVEKIGGGIEKIRVTEFRARKANAYRFGTLWGEPQTFDYTFEQEEYQKGVDADTRIRNEIAAGMR